MVSVTFYYSVWYLLLLLLLLLGVVSVIFIPGAEEEDAFKGSAC